MPFHGVAFVDLGRLLYPGVKRTRGAYSIQPFSEEEILEKVTLMRTENVCATLVCLFAIKNI